MIINIERTKYIGITKDQHLKWDVQEQNLIIKMRRPNCFFLNARKILNKQTLRIVYSIVMQPMPHYGITAWGRGLGIVASNKLIKAKKSIMQIINYNPKTFPSGTYSKILKF